jgi:hypothetical protein
MSDKKTILHNNLEAFLKDFQDAVLDGYFLDKENPPTTYGFSYEAILVKDDKRSRYNAERIINGHPKLTRAEILEKARAAKDAKAQAAQEEK